jgi:Skp family chaperone for outer membrane proteins
MVENTRRKYEAKERMRRMESLRQEIEREAELEAQRRAGELNEVCSSDSGGDLCEKVGSEDQLQELGALVLRQMDEGIKYMTNRAEHCDSRQEISSSSSSSSSSLLSSSAAAAASSPARANYLGANGQTMPMPQGAEQWEWLRHVLSQHSTEVAANEERITQLTETSLSLASMLRAAQLKEEGREREQEKQRQEQEEKEREQQRAVQELQEKVKALSSALAATGSSNACRSPYQREGGAHEMQMVCAPAPAPLKHRSSSIISTASTISTIYSTPTASSAAASAASAASSSSAIAPGFSPPRKDAAAVKASATAAEAITSLSFKGKDSDRPHKSFRRRLRLFSCSP